MDRTVALKFILLLVGLGVCVSVWVPQLLGYAPAAEHFAIHFLDVGQGDAVLVQTPDGYEALIDGGAHRGVLRAIAEQQAWYDRTIDVMIATHADTDHVGGLVDVLAQYDVDVILQTEATSDSPAALAFIDSVDDENAAVIHARAGQTLQLGASTTIEVLAPASDTSNWRPNNASIIVKITYGDTAILLPGDAPQSIENYLAGTHDDALQAGILKLGHHGSKTSTSDLFLDTVQPQYAVVSAGLDNRYGHPHHEVMQRVFARDIQSFHTGVDGTISFYSDGVRVWYD